MPSRTALRAVGGRGGRARSSAPSLPHPRHRAGTFSPRAAPAPHGVRPRCAPRCAGGGEHTGSGPAERGDPWAGSRRPPQPHPGCPASPTRRRARLCHMAAAGREEEEPSQRKPHPSSRSRSCSQPGSILSPGLSCILLAQPRAGRAAQMGAKSVGTPPGAVRAVPCCAVPHDPPGPACRWGLTNPVLVQDQTPRPSSLDLCADLQPCPVDPHLSHPCPHPSPYSHTEDVRRKRSPVVTTGLWDGGDGAEDSVAECGDRALRVTAPSVPPPGYGTAAAERRDGRPRTPTSRPRWGHRTQKEGHNGPTTPQPRKPTVPPQPAAPRMPAVQWVHNGGAAAQPPHAMIRAHTQLAARRRRGVPITRELI